MPNTEVDIIHYLLTEKDLRNELRAAFYNHEIIGAIYLEARFSRHPIHGRSLLDTLSGLVDVRLSTLRVVPEQDYNSSLRPSLYLSHPFYSTGDWVTVGHGLYKDDVGLVMGYVETMGTGKHNIGVLLVPRLVMNFDADKDEFEQTSTVRKRKRSPGKPRPVLFSLDKCGARSAELVSRVPLDEARTEQDYKHRILGYFSHGLTLRYYTPTSLTPATAIPHELMHLFVKSKHPIFEQAPLLQPDTWQFFPGEKVLYSAFGVVGTSELTTGTIRAVTERGCEVESEEGFHHIPTLQLRKVIHPGDYVRVLHGTHKDITGLVGAVTVRVVGLISEYGKTISIWVDINTVTLTDSSCLVHNFPWKNVEVRVLSGIFQGMKAVVKNVSPDGHGSLEVTLFIPAIHHSCEVDYTEIVEYRHLHQFRHISAIFYPTETWRQ
ncbi:hypothetical protein EV361DRAFT_391082 [Lentinula raphanica]|nr:hypothetical protein EV361DRAFT_391082 [Lentinula raphanica]